MLDFNKYFFQYRIGCLCDENAKRLTPGFSGTGLGLRNKDSFSGIGLVLQDKDRFLRYWFIQRIRKNEVD